MVVLDTSVVIDALHGNSRVIGAIKISSLLPKCGNMYLRVLNNASVHSWL